ncbi:MAG: carboxypeptidase regulatory-like domain-containing protein [Acidobacteria bacterium]|nr:carboxypeptidase regulatory-like domain-containing protein [Acidobacteriota bacterium]
MSLAVSVCLAATAAAHTARWQKQHVVARGRLDNTNTVYQIAVWQTANPPGSALPYAKAHMAIETSGKNARTIFHTDGGDTQYLVDAIQLADLDGDGIAEILSLWWEGASAGAVLRVFHFDTATQSFVELKADDDLSGLHRYRLVGAAKPRVRRRIAVYARPAASSSRTEEYELRDAKIVAVKTGGGRKPVETPKQSVSGIEGQTVIGPTRPHINVGDPTPDVAPFQATLLLLTASDHQEVKRLETGSDGRFRVALPPGEYLIRPIGGQTRMSPRANEQTVRVVAGQFTRITITFDSGMR